MHDKTIEWGYYSAEIKWKYDEDPDVSHLVGKCTDSRDEYVFDRRDGLLLGGYVEQTFIVKWDDVPGADMNEQGWILSSTWDKAAELIEAQIKAAGINYYSPQNGDYKDVRFDEDTNEFYAEISGYKILADELGNYIHRNNQYRYVYANENHLPHNPESWRGISPESMDGESFEAADIRYAVEDWQRWERFNLDYWCMMGCEVTIYKDGVEIASSSLWGIESDGGNVYIAETERDVLSDALHQAGIDIPAEELLKEAEEA